MLLLVMISAYCNRQSNRFFPINVLHIVDCDTDLYLYSAAKRTVSVNQHNDQFMRPRTVSWRHPAAILENYML